jgi:SNF2 family DNA or RNA helicase
MAEITKTNDGFFASFRYDARKVAFIKTLTGRSYDPMTKTWLINATEENLAKLRQSGLFSIASDCHPNIAMPVADCHPNIAIPVANIDGNRIVLKISSQSDAEFQQNLKFVKTLSGRSWKKKTWSCFLTIENAKNILNYGFVSPPLKKWYEENNKQITHIPELLGKPYPFQWEALNFLERTGGKTLLADDMGLGKTLQTLMWLALHPEKRPVVITCGATLKINWDREIRKWIKTPGKIQILSGSPSEKNRLGSADFYILNYDILQKWEAEFDKISVFVIDEVQFLKNPKALRTKAGQKFAKKAAHVIGVSGTPIENRPLEFYGILRMLGKIFSYDEYTTKYCGAKQTRFGRDCSGATNLKQLNDELKNVMIRRKKGEVLKDLPDMTQIVIPFELAKKDMAEYNRAQKHFLSWLDSEEKRKKAERAEQLTKINELRQLAAKLKMAQCVEWIGDFFDQSDEKLVVFAHHKEIIDEIMQSFPNISVKIDGSMNQSDRQKSIDEFQNNPDIRLFVGSIGAAAEGITLTAASNVVFVEQSWKPSKMDQCAARVHRIGQKNAVSVWHLVAVNTIDEWFYNIIDSKRAVIDTILDGKLSEETAIIGELIEKIKK